MSLELKLSSDEKTDKFFFDESLFENYCYVPAVFLGRSHGSNLFLERDFCDHIFISTCLVSMVWSKSFIHSGV